MIKADLDINRQRSHIDYYEQIIETGYEAQCPITVCGLEAERAFKDNQFI